MTDRERLILLNTVPDIGGRRIHRLQEALGSLEAVLAADAARLQTVDRIGPEVAKQVVEACRQPDRLARELAAAEAVGARIVTCLDADYPAPLRTIPDPPAALYMKGSWTAPDAAAVAIVGARRATFYGQQTAERLAYELALRGVTIVSGLAIGIDGAAHRGALKAGGRTIGIIGSGMDRLYPEAHAGLAREIAERGAVCSEYPMGMPPLAVNFPRRNRLLSGLALGVIVVEASARSGALITADCALEQGREVMAVPGQVDSPSSQGTHKLLRQGARLVAGVEDVLDALQLELTRCLEPAPVRESEDADAEPAGADRSGADGDEGRLVACLRTRQAIALDALAAQSGLPVSRCATLLTQLELRHRVRQLPGKRFALLAAPVIR
jgi:DNA processing protein